MRALKSAIFAILLAGFTARADFADDSPLSKTQFDAVKSACAEALPSAEFFPAAAALARAKVTALCSGQVRFTNKEALFVDIVEVTQSLGNEAAGTGIPWSEDDELDEMSLAAFAAKLVEDIRTYEAALDGTGPDDGAIGLPSVAAQPATSLGPANLTHGDFTVIPESQEACDNALQGRSCNDYLAEFASVYRAIARFYSSADAAPTWKALQKLDSDWTDFMNATADQTPLELLWNGYLFRKKYGDVRSLVAPPKTQQILLKPYVAGDYLGEAPDGSQLNETVVLDVWGIKRWDASDVPWYQPIGFSIHTAYSDRPAVEDWGYGLSVHFTEANTLGVTSFDGEIGVFLSFDLWKNATKAYAEGQQRVMEFRMRRDEYRTRFNELKGLLTPEE